ncbi:TetR/AcrR family transcriptional regulator [Amphritea sp. 1_MG-2023]|uniref:TetR/AcrR family transcriptional regulator n=1 Tax=Amphritea sp. 1_MG-2023 TaxID=3062670 RepID=UPI0026E393A5|nr:TetR/AcrR family transcriptional regulator [Amphritea sp. 1_MG-2023]MDO6564165.1 TetR/AcrR family transcriptional regulator [Amphritea sp. 1_MG-2023]
MLKEQIAASLEQAFSQYGFAEPSVAQLKTACHVSLRTLYKHYPSKEAMVVAALEHRHQRYLSFLLQDAPGKGIESVVHIFDRLEEWMSAYAPHGCLSVNAMAAFPDNAAISCIVQQHKAAVRVFLGEQSLRDDLATPIFILHEGIASAWPMLGREAITAAQQILLTLQKG